MQRRVSMTLFITNVHAALWLLQRFLFLEISILKAHVTLLRVFEIYRFKHEPFIINIDAMCEQPKRISACASVHLDTECICIRFKICTMFVICAGIFLVIAYSVDPRVSNKHGSPSLFLVCQVVAHEILKQI